MDKLIVHGYTEAICHIPAIILIRLPDAFIGIDAPDFNLRRRTCNEGLWYLGNPFCMPVNLGIAQ